MVLVSFKVDTGTYVEIHNLRHIVHHCTPVLITYYPKSKVFSYKLEHHILHSQASIEKLLKMCGFSDMRSFNLKHQNLLVCDGDFFSMSMFLLEFTTKSVIFEL